MRNVAWFLAHPATVGGPQLQEVWCAWCARDDLAINSHVGVLVRFFALGCSSGYLLINCDVRNKRATKFSIQKNPAV